MIHCCIYFLLALFTFACFCRTYIPIPLKTKILQILQLCKKEDRCFNCMRFRQIGFNYIVMILFMKSCLFIKELSLLDSSFMFDFHFIIVKYQSFGFDLVINRCFLFIQSNLWHSMLNLCCLQKDLSCYFSSQISLRGFEKYHLFYLMVMINLMLYFVKLNFNWIIKCLLKLHLKYLLNLRHLCCLFTITYFNYSVYWKYFKKNFKLSRYYSILHQHSSFIRNNSDCFNQHFVKHLNYLNLIEEKYSMFDFHLMLNSKMSYSLCLNLNLLL